MIKCTRPSPSENTPTRNFKLTEHARGGGRRPGFEARLVGRVRVARPAAIYALHALGDM